MRNTKKLLEAPGCDALNTPMTCTADFNPGDRAGDMARPLPWGNIGYHGQFYRILDFEQIGLKFFAKVYLIKVISFLFFFLLWSEP